MKNVRVLAYGWFGAGNIGDELLLERLATWCRELGAALVALSIDPAHTRTTHGIEAVDAFDLPSVIRAMQASDLFVLGGGGLFQTHQPFSIAALYRFGGPDIATYARPALMARQMGLPILLWAHGVGPLETDEARQIVREVFEAASLVSVRDEHSRQLLVEAGVRREVIVAPDPVWTWPIPRQASERLRTSKRIALVLRPWPFVPLWEERFVQALRRTVPAEGHTLVWMSFQMETPVRPAEGADNTFIRDLMERVGSAYAHEWAHCSSVAQAAQALAGCDVVISMRLHAQILALKLDKPTLCIEYDAKMGATSLLAGVPERLRLKPEASFEAWANALAACMDQARAPTGEPSARDRLALDALEHRHVLERALTLAGTADKRPPWQALHFDWLSAWTHHHSHQVVLQCSEQITQLERRASDLQQQLLALRELNTELGEVNTQLASDLASMASHNAKLQHACRAREFDIARIMHSRSWTLTAPLRHLKQLAQNPRKTGYALAKAAYWQLPPVARNALQGTRHRFVRWARNTPLPSAGKAPVRPGAPSDLSWDDFRKQVLAQRDRYKGVFVQEAVIDWNVPLYQRPQHIACAFGRMGYLVIYRTTNWTHDDVEGFREVSQNVWITNRYEVNTLQNVVRSIYSTAYVNTPDLILENGRRGLLVYEYIDHIDPQISGDAENIRRLVTQKEFAFGGGADYVVASSQKLLQEAVQAVGAEKTVLAQNGVDTRHYRNPTHLATQLPDKLLTFRHRFPHIVGYFGALAPWLWYEAIADLVHSRPDLGFVFIGPDYYGGADQLPASANVLYLGTVDYRVLPAYARQFDVCFIPFSPGEIARTTSPLKLFEYFALEKPVVVTSDMHECTVFDEVFAGDSAASLSEALDAALQVKDDPGYRQRLARLADENDWDQRVRAMEPLFRALPVATPSLPHEPTAAVDPLHQP